MPYPNEHSARIRPPGDFTRIVQLQELPNGIRILGGPLKSDPSGSGKPQAYRFPKDKFTVAQAKTWLREHDITWILFEPASGGSQEIAEIDSHVAHTPIPLSSRNAKHPSLGRKPTARDLR